MAERRRMTGLYRQFITPGDLCFDVGANNGHRTLVLKRLGARVIAIEPQKICLHRLYNRFWDVPEVTIVAQAVGDKAGYAELAVCREIPSISTLSTRWRTEGRWAQKYTWNLMEKVPVVTLDTLIELYGLPKLCKIDVEGFEEQVLLGLSQVTPLISFEAHYEMLDETERCLAHLAKLGSYECNFSPADDLIFTFPKWITAKELLNYLQTDKKIWGDIYIRFLGMN